MHVPNLIQMPRIIIIGFLVAWLLSWSPQTSITPSFRFGSAMDAVWRSLAQRRFQQSKEQRIVLRSELIDFFRTHPELPEPPELNDLNEAEITTNQHYGKLPDVLVDQGHGAIFPQPMGAPQEYSWNRTAKRCGVLSKKTHELRRTFQQSNRKEPLNLSAFITTLNQQWIAIHQEALLASQEIRYLNFWLPLLVRDAQHFQTTKTKSIYEQFTQALKQNNADTIKNLQESFRPSRIFSRSFLPGLLTSHSRLALPITTDIADRRFLAEFEGALETHWNQSPWARSQKIRFQIDWKHIPLDDDFAAGRISLTEHLARFPEDSAILTTGGLTTHVNKRSLILSPDKVNARTLAHEIGHLLGFGDCYFRTLTSRGFGGLNVLEWNNPFYPDELMCNNHIGVTRTLKW